MVLKKEKKKRKNTAVVCIFDEKRRLKLVEHSISNEYYMYIEANVTLIDQNNYFVQSLQVGYPGRWFSQK